MNQISPINQVIINYFKFYGSYILLAFVILLLGSILGFSLNDFGLLIMLTGAGSMIFTIVRVNKKSTCLKEFGFYYIHFIWTSMLLITGLIIYYFIGFSTETEFIAEDGMRNIVISDTLFSSFFLFFIQASLISTLILLIKAIIIKKMRPILISTASLAGIIIYFVLVV